MKKANDSEFKIAKKEEFKSEKDKWYEYEKGPSCNSLKIVLTPSRLCEANTFISKFWSTKIETVNENLFPKALW